MEDRRFPKIEITVGKISEPEELVCPFCGMREFDRIGLKYHLENYCSEYQGVEDLD